MTTDTLKEANQLRVQIDELDRFIRTIKNNRCLRIFDVSLKRKKSMILCATDYMRPYEYYEVSQKTRERILQVLEEEIAELRNEFDMLQ